MTPTRRRRRARSTLAPLGPALPVVPPALAEAVREAREHAGLSQRALAEACGVSNSTVAGIENGADAQWATLAALQAVLPGLAARDLLPNPAGHPPPAMAAAWRAHRDVFGWECERVVVTARLGGSEPRMSMSVGPVRWSDRRPLDELATSALARVIHGGSGRDVLALDPRPLWRDGALAAGAGRRFTLAAARDALSCAVADEACPQVAATEAGDPKAAASFTLDYPVQELVLVLETQRQKPLRPRALAWLPGGMSEPWASELLRFLHPRRHPQVRSSGKLRRAELRLHWPPVGVTYALFDAADDPKAGRVTRAQRRVHAPARDTAEVGKRLSIVRRDKGLSLREMADHLGISFTTVHALENGLGGRASILARYAEAFPDLAPQDLLPAMADEGTLDRESLRHFYVRLFGFEAERLRRRLTLRNDEHSRTVLMTENLRASGRRAEPVRLRTYTRHSLSLREPPPATVQGGEGKLRRRTYREDGRVITEFIVPRDVAERGTSYRRTWPWRPAYHFSSKDLLASGGEPPVIEGMSQTLTQPAIELELEVRFPTAFVPETLGFAGWPASYPPLPDEGACVDMLGRFEATAHFDRRTRRARLTVRHPLPHVRFGCWWVVP